MQYTASVNPWLLQGALVLGIPLTHGCSVGSCAHARMTRCPYPISPTQILRALVSDAVLTVATSRAPSSGIDPRSPFVLCCRIARDKDSCSITNRAISLRGHKGDPYVKFGVITYCRARLVSSETRTQNLHVCIPETAIEQHEQQCGQVPGKRKSVPVR